LNAVALGFSDGVALAIGVTSEAVVANGAGALGVSLISSEISFLACSTFGSIFAGALTSSFVFQSTVSV